MKNIVQRSAVWLFLALSIIVGAEAAPIATTRPDGLPIIHLGTVSGAQCTALAKSPALTLNQNQGVLVNGIIVMERAELEAMCKTGAKLDVSLFAAVVTKTENGIKLQPVSYETCRAMLEKLHFSKVRVDGKDVAGEQDLALCNRKGGVTVETLE